MRIGILGFGRFGKALGSLLQEAGHVYRAWDPVAEVPAEFRAVQWTRLAGGEGAPVEKFCARVQQVLGDGAALPSTPPGRGGGGDVDGAMPDRLPV